MVKPRMGLLGLAGKLEVGFGEALSLVKRLGTVLGQFGDVVSPYLVLSDAETVREAIRFFQGQEYDLLVVAVATWSEDHHLLDFLEVLPCYVLLWAFPAVDTGSLCGVHQIACVLKELGLPYAAVYGEPEDELALQEARVIIRTLALRRFLRTVKIGVIGGRIHGMTEIAFDELELKARTGVRLINLSEMELVGRVENVDVWRAEEEWQEVKARVGVVNSVDEAGIEAMRYFLALKGLVEEFDLQGLCVRCYPDFMGRVCLAYSLLAEEGIVCGCEGDAANTIAMKLLFELTGEPVHNTDLLYPDPATKTVLFSHCGSGAFSLASSSKFIQLAPVRLMDRGVCALFPSRPGPVTLVNLVGRRGTLRLSTWYGEAVETGMEFPGNPLKVRFATDFALTNRRILEEGIGHHWMAGYGDVRRELELYCGLSSIRYIGL
ncbi:MAG: hypothetical protein HPY68_00615 [Candidatus Atribacteria bacterium]|nr:hypothetical protein [Candidatus Atribacteria bacterium]